MRRLGIITLFAALFCFMITGAAMAYTLPFAPGLNVNAGDNLSMHFSDYEYWVDSNANHYVDAGDTIYGVYRIDGIADSTLGTPYYTVEGFLGGNFTYNVVGPTTNPSTTLTFKDEMSTYYNPYVSSVVLYDWKGPNITSYLNPGLKVGGLTTDTFSAGMLSPYTNYDGTWVAGQKIAGISSVPMTLTYSAYSIFNMSLTDWYMNSYIMDAPSVTPYVPYTPSYQTALSTTGNFTWGSTDPISVTFHPVPEPATIMLLGAGLFGLGSFGRKKSKKNRDEA